MRNKSPLVVLWITLSLMVPALVIYADAAPFAYITSYDANTVSVVDTATNTVMGSPIPVGSHPWGVAVSPAGTRVYVANFGSGSVSVIDTATNTVVGSPISVGNMPYGVAVNPAGTRVYVSNYGGSTVSVIDTATNTVVGAPIGVGSSPAGIAVSPAGTRVYVANLFSDSVSVIDTSTNTVVGSGIPAGSEPCGIAVNPAGTRVYVADYTGNAVSVIDTATNTVVGAPIGVGSNPIGVATNPVGTRVYVANQLSDTVSVIDTATNTVVGSIAVGHYPYGVAVNPAGTRLYVANQLSNTLSVIDTATNTVVGSVAVDSNPLALGQFIVSPSVQLSPGWNFISIPRQISDTGGVTVNLLSGSGAISSYNSNPQFTTTGQPAGTTVRSAVEYEVTGVPAGGAASVSITFSSMPVTPQFFRVINDVWIPLDLYVLNGTILTHVVTDNGPFDSDPVLGSVKDSIVMVSSTRDTPAPAIDAALAPISSNIDVVWAWDSATRTWLRYSPVRPGNTLSFFRSGKGYWFHMNNAALLFDAGSEGPSTISLSEGWNLVGYNGPDNTALTTGLTGIDGKWLTLWGWNAGTWSIHDERVADTSLPAGIPALTTFDQGRAYWVRVKPGMETNWNQ